MRVDFRRWFGYCVVWHGSCALYGASYRVADERDSGSGGHTEEFMKTGKALVTTLFAMASFPLLAQQTPPAQPANPATQQTPAGTMPQSQAAAAPMAEMSPVNGELVGKLDSKTAKAGDSVVVQTKSSAKTSDGTEIPKGSKLVGKVMGVHASTSGDNSQVVVKFDHLELKGGQSVPVQSQIESIGSAGSGSPAVMSEAPAAGAANPGSAPGSAAGSGNPGVAGATGTSRASGVPQSTPGGSGAAAAGGPPAAGTVVARTGNIAIRTTSVPGVLVANNEPGQRDPRMAQASSILLGAKQDVELEGGTQMVVGVASAAAGAQ